MNRERFPQWLIFSAFGLSGSAALIYEVVWFKVLSLVAGSTVYAISTMLAAFMGGLSLGAYLGGRRADALKEPELALGFIELGIGAAGILTLVLIAYIQPLYAILYMKFSTSFAFFSFTQFFICFLIMMVPTTLMGATFPVACKALVKGTDEVGKDTGYAYAVNTVGAIAGSMAAGFLLIPSIGLKGANIAAASINILTALALIGCAKGWGRGKTVVLLTAVVGGLFLVRPAVYAVDFIYPFNYYLARQFGDAGGSPWFFGPGWRAGRTPLFNRENAYGVVWVYRIDASGQKVLMNNGKIEGGTGAKDKNNQVLLALLPLAFRPDARSFLNIGLGSGMTLSAAVESGVEEVYSLEINPAVIEAVKGHFYPALFDNRDRPRSIVADARNYLAMNPKRYDIISSEPSYPTDDSVSHLFTKEFFDLVRTRLDEDGVFCQWVPFHILGNRGTTVMIKTFLKAFPNAYIFNVISPEGAKGADILMIGSNSSGRLSFEEIRRRVPPDKLAGGLDAFKPALKEGQEEEIRRNRKIPVNTDDRPIIEFMAAKGMLGI